MSQSNERPFTFRHVALPNPPAERSSDPWVKVYHDQERTFTYLNTEFMTEQQKNAPVPKICRIYVSGVVYTWRSIRPDVTNRAEGHPDQICVLREIAPGDIGWFQAEKGGYIHVFVEDRRDLQKLSPKSQDNVFKANIISVREEEFKSLTYVLDNHGGNLLRPEENEHVDVGQSDEVAEGDDMAENSEVAGRSHTFTIQHVALPTSAPEGSWPGYVKIYDNQKRTFTYIDTTLMNDQQKNAPAPIICTIGTPKPSWNILSPEVTIPTPGRPNEVYALREIMPGDQALFDAQRKGCNWVYDFYVEDRRELEKLGRQAMKDVRKALAVPVRKITAPRTTLGI